ncbi:MAG: hypothetical protein DMF50_02595 [Acidobacteria bacterium]|nr:MAG: hypothetical protein DMF50_02595 [Acidobacteriota bacterium]
MPSSKKRTKRRGEAAGAASSGRCSAAWGIVGPVSRAATSRNSTEAIGFTWPSIMRTKSCGPSPRIGLPSRSLT